MVPGKVSAPVNVLVNGRQRKVGRKEVQPLIPVIKTPKSPFKRQDHRQPLLRLRRLPLADFKRAGKAFGGTLNDAVVAVCAGALRRYMLAIGETPTEPLIVCVPAMLNTGDEKERWANHISMFFAEFPTHVAAPVERLRLVHEDLRAAKENFDALPTDLFRDAMRYDPQVLWNTSVKLMNKSPDWVPGATWNVVVSNVRGPNRTVEVCGATMQGYWPAAFLTPGIGLNITLQSYQDKLDFGFMGCSDLIPDLWDLPGFMEQSLAELLAAIDLTDETAAPAGKSAAIAAATSRQQPTRKRASTKNTSTARTIPATPAKSTTQTVAKTTTSTTRKATKSSPTRNSPTTSVTNKAHAKKTGSTQAAPAPKLARANPATSPTE